MIKIYLDQNSGGKISLDDEFFLFKNIKELKEILDVLFKLQEKSTKNEPKR